MIKWVSSNKNRNYLIYVFILVASLMMFLVYLFSSDNSFLSTSEDIIGTNVVGPITKGDILVQNFTCKNDVIQELQICFATYAKINNSKLTVKLKQNNELIESWNIEANELRDNEYYSFKLSEEVHHARGEIFSIEIQTNAEVENAVTVYINDGAYNQSDTESLTISGEKIDNSVLSYKIIYNKIDKNTIFLFCSIIIALSSLFVVILLIKEKKKIEHVFLVLFLTLSAVYWISVPVFKTPDEGAHYLRIYEISEGHLSSKINEEGNAGRLMPNNVYLKQFSDAPKIKWFNVKDAIDVELDHENKIFHQFASSALYAPVQYIPQAAGVIIAKLFTDNIVFISYIARIFNWFAITLIIYWAIKMVPVGKILILTIVLLPMNIHQSISMSPDGLLNALSIALVSMVLYFIYNRELIISNKDIILMYFLTITLSLCKIVYVPLSLLLFCIPKKRFGIEKRYKFHVFMLGSIIIIANLVWLYIASHYFIEFNEGVNGMKQVQNVLSNPLQYISTLANTFYEYGEYYLFTMLGGNLGWMNIIVNRVVLLIYLILIIYVVIKKDFLLNKLSKCTSRLLFGSSILVLLLIATSLYVQWTRVGEKLISGIQGRYFIPILVPLLLCAGNLWGSNGENTKDKESIGIYLMIFFVNTCAALTMLYGSI